MKASQYCKSLGCKSVAEVSRVTEVPARTLFKWANERPRLFKAVCLGSLQMGDK